MPASVPIMVSGPRVEFFRTGVLSLDTGKMTLLLTNESNRGNSALTRSDVRPSKANRASGA